MFCVSSDDSVLNNSLIKVIWKSVFIILEAILPFLETGLARVILSLFSLDSNATYERLFLFNFVGLNNPIISFEKVSRFNLLIMLCICLISK